MDILTFYDFNKEMFPLLITKLNFSRNHNFNKDDNINKQRSSNKFTFPPKPEGQTDIRTDISIYKVASLLKNNYGVIPFLA